MGTAATDKFVRGDILGFRSHNHPDRYVRHRDSLGYAESSEIGGGAFKEDTSWVVRSALLPRANGQLLQYEGKSLESVKNPGFYLRQVGERVRLDRYDVSENFQWAASWYVKPGLADGSKVSFESVEFAGRYLRHRNGELWMDQNDGSSLLKEDATFGPIIGFAAPPTWTLTVAPAPSRGVIKGRDDYVDRLDCGYIGGGQTVTKCSTRVTRGTTLMVSRNGGDTGYRSDGWTGDCARAGTSFDCALTMDWNKTISATCTRIN